MPSTTFCKILTVTRNNEVEIAQDFITDLHERLMANEATPSEPIIIGCTFRLSSMSEVNRWAQKLGATIELFTTFKINKTAFVTYLCNPKHPVGLINMLFVINSTVDEFNNFADNIGLPRREAS